MAASNEWLKKDFDKEIGKMRMKFPSHIHADDLASTNKILFCCGDFYVYWSGYYQKWAEEQLFSLVRESMGSDCGVTKIKEVITYLKAACFKPADFITNRDFLNLKNGLIDVNTLAFSDHNLETISTIQLNANYNPDATCPGWRKALDEIFEGDQKKMGLLQEYFGLTLTPETRYEKALFLFIPQRMARREMFPSMSK